MRSERDVSVAAVRQSRNAGAHRTNQGLSEVLCVVPTCLNQDIAQELPGAELQLQGASALMRRVHGLGCLVHLVLDVLASHLTKRALRTAELTL